jgi:hypothetical protein
LRSEATICIVTWMKANEDSIPYEPTKDGASPTTK